MEMPFIRVMALHALAYCERLFYLEEVEEIRLASDRVYAGRTLHESQVDRGEEWSTIELQSETWSLKGKVDYVCYREGRIIAYEHKRGRSKGDQAWQSDRLQAIAYCALLSEHFGKPVTTARIRYHANNKTVEITVDESALAELKAAITQAQALAARIERPPVAENEIICRKCSLAPVCLPEEERFLEALEDTTVSKPERLFPAIEERRVVHITEPGSQIRRLGEQVVVYRLGAEPVKFPARDIAALVLHGGVQISSQTIHYASAHDIAVHWLTAGGSYVGGLAPAGGVQRRLRQYEGLRDNDFCRELARRLVKAKVENQIRFLLRSARNRNQLEGMDNIAKSIQAELCHIERAADIDELRGHEGMAGHLYFSVLPTLLDESQSLMAFSGRNRRPPLNSFNAALSFAIAYCIVIRWRLLFVWVLIRHLDSSIVRGVPLIL